MAIWLLSIFWPNLQHSCSEMQLTGAINTHATPGYDVSTTVLKCWDQTPWCRQSRISAPNRFIFVSSDNCMLFQNFIAWVNYKSAFSYLEFSSCFLRGCQPWKSCSGNNYSLIAVIETFIAAITSRISSRFSTILLA